MKRVLGGGIAVAGVATMVLFSATTLASATTAAVSQVPSTVMPYVNSTNSTVRQIVQCGNTMFVVGAFSTVGATNKATVTRHNAFSFNATTGALSSWNPNPNSTVDSIAVSPDCTTAYLGGAFTTIQGKTATRLAKVSTSTGVADTTFKPAPTSEVFTVVLSGAHLIVGGSFGTIAGTSRPALASVNPISGKIDPYVNLSVTGTLPNSGKKIYNFQLSHSGTKLLAEGSFTSVGGKTRSQIFMIDLGTSSATVDNWNSADFGKACVSSIPFYIRGAGWSPDDQFVYTAATGATGASPICDSVAKFSSSASSTQLPIWINKTGCDSVYSIAADDTNVYVGGHNRWLDNPKGCDKAGPGALSRPGIGDINAQTGLATSWNPTRSRGHGADDVLLTPAGLWVASDTYLGAVYCAGKFRPGVCFFPK
jgi:hypothetical protein